MSKPVLVIACGNKKRADDLERYPYGTPVWDLYLGRAWDTYRKWMEAHDIARHSGAKRMGGSVSNPLDVWVVSAEHGLLPSTSRLWSYNTQLTPATFSSFVEVLSEQLHASGGGALGRERRALLHQSVTFAGPKIYAEALEAAGLQITPISWRAKGGGAGWGSLGQNLRRWLDQQIRSTASSVDLDALILAARKRAR
jgi:hypothetical protein